MTPRPSLPRARHPLAAALFLIAGVLAEAALPRVEAGAPEGQVAGRDSAAPFARAEALEAAGKRVGAYRAYMQVARRHRREPLAGEAMYHAARCLEGARKFGPAFGLYQKVVEQFPHLPYFAEIVQRQYRIANMYFTGDLRPFLGFRRADSYAESVVRFEQVVKNAPYSPQAPEAQYRIGLAHEQLREFGLAVAAYEKVPENYPDHPLVEPAKYRLAESYYQLGISRSADKTTYEQALERFLDFMVQFPDSESAPAAQERIAELRQRLAEELLRIARFYRKRRQSDSARIYLQTILRAYNDTPSAEPARAMLEELTGSTQEPQQS